MELFKEIYETEKTEFDESKLNLREASRVVLVDENGKIPLLFVSKHNYHKLPGGGVDPGEDKHQALIRECLEEVGCEIEIEGEVGKIIEYRLKWDLKQISYCYFGKITSYGEPSFTEKELSEGFKVVWLDLNDAILQLEEDKPDNYEGEFIQRRDLVLLKKAKEIMAQSF